MKTFVASSSLLKYFRVASLSSSSGYIYYISLKGVTGSELKVSDELEKRVLSIKEQTDLPVVVGFGIKDAITAKKMSSCSDGVVVGSLLVDEISKFSSKEDNIMNKKLTSIIDELKEGIA
jgi:tryptophan synthase alpha chain